MLAALKATNSRLQDHTFLFQGAGEVSIPYYYSANVIVAARNFILQDI